jgi:SSS family solute:Na+ symporter
MMMAVLISIFMTLSPLGLAAKTGIPASFGWWLAAVWAGALLLMWLLTRNNKTGVECARDHAKS